jgi:uncharacterized membrane protein YcaP (DUF421 family)
MTLQDLWGEGEHINALQMSSRAFVMFFIAFALIRLGGMRIFGKKSAFDNVVGIMLGAVLARGIVGASSFIGTVCACIVMLLIHRSIAWASLKSPLLANLFKGQAMLLYKDGSILWDNMKKSAISEKDLMESLKLETKKTSLDGIDTVWLETNGRISFVEKT